jgi:HAE1 family hydrophobic/amphiphilic exporter-1
MQIQQRQTSDDVKAFEKVVRNFIAEVQKDPAIGSANSFYGAHTPNYTLNVDREKCKRLGVPVSEVFNTIQTFIGSYYINDISLYSRNFHVVAQADTNYRTDIAKLNGFFVRNQADEMLPLSSLVTYTPTETAPLVSHFNIFRSAEINGSPQKGYSSGQALDALRKTAARTLPDGYGYEFSGLSYEEVQAGNTSTIIFNLMHTLSSFTPCVLLLS